MNLKIQRKEIRKMKTRTNQTIFKDNGDEVKDANLLPDVSASDNGKVPVVTEGGWGLGSASDKYSITNIAQLISNYPNYNTLRGFMKTIKNSNHLVMRGYEIQFANDEEGQPPQESDVNNICVRLDGNVVNDILDVSQTILVSGEDYSAYYIFYFNGISYDSSLNKTIIKYIEIDNSMVDIDYTFNWSISGVNIYFK